jgi:zinc D-Ala-D-Ala carboxypeptidase
MSARFLTAPVTDHCLDRDLAAPPAVDPVYTLLDRSYALPPDYVPPDLVSVSEARFAGNELLRAIVMPDLAALGDAISAAGLSLIVESGYRSYEAQAATFAYWIGVEGSAAVLRAARPGHSEHQLGTAIDVTSPGWSGRVGDWGTESAEGAWMAEHAWEFGFVMSYPPGGDGTSCFGYEPWHYRWIGRDAAAAHRASGEPLRLFLVRYLAG